MENTAIIPLEARTELLKLRLLYLLTGLAGGLFNPYLTTLFVHQGIGANLVGVLMSIGTLLSIIVQPVWGLLVDRYRQTKLVLLLSICVPASLSFFYGFKYVAVIIMAYFLSIIFQSTQSPVADSYAVSAAQKAVLPMGRSAAWAVWVQRWAVMPAGSICRDSGYPSYGCRFLL